LRILKSIPGVVRNGSIVGTIYQQLSVKRQLRARYQAYVEMGVDEEIATFYGKDNQMPYLGSEEFRDWAYQQRQSSDDGVSAKELKAFRPTIEQITKTVADHFCVDIDSIRASGRSKTVENVPRWVVMYLAQEDSGLKLREIADYMRLKRTEGIPATMAKLKSRLKSDHKLSGAVEAMKHQ
jgi:hypothetical protein